MARRLQRHHVGRALGAVAPVRCNRHAALELDHPLVGSPQAPVSLQRPHRDRHPRRVQAGDHRRYALGIDVGPVREQGGIHRQEFCDSFCPVAQERLAVVAQGIDLQQEIGELDVPDLSVNQLAQAARFAFVGQRCDGRQMEHALGIDVERALLAGFGHRRRRRPPSCRGGGSSSASAVAGIPNKDR